MMTKQENVTPDDDDGLEERPSIIEHLRLHPPKNEHTLEGGHTVCSPSISGTLARSCRAVHQRRGKFV